MNKEHVNTTENINENVKSSLNCSFNLANFDQTNAITTIDGPLLIIAGPGTGKTFTLIQRILYMVTVKGIKPNEILISTFTKKAASELVFRLNKEFSKCGITANVDEMYIGTIHSICQRILAENFKPDTHTKIKIKKNFKVADEIELRFKLFWEIKKCKSIIDLYGLSDFNGFKRKGQEWVYDAWNTTKSIISNVNSMQELLIDVDTLLKSNKKSFIGAGEITQLYNKMLEDNNLLDYSKLQTAVYSLLSNYPEVLSHLQEKIKYIMVDEYQDTNFIQEQLMLKLAGENSNICVVGDDDQGLYRFRGATIKNILYFKNNFSKGACNVVSLTTNYRSKKSIIDYYNNWMKELNWGSARFGKCIVPCEEHLTTDVRVVKCSSVEGGDAYNKRICKFIKDMLSNGIVSDYSQIAFLSSDTANYTDLIKYLELNDIPVYAPHFGLYFEREEIKLMIGSLLLAFPQISKVFEDEDYNNDIIKFMPDKNVIINYYNECIETVKSYPELKTFLDIKAEIHIKTYSNLDYSFSGLFYKILAVAPFNNYIINGKREARNLVIFLKTLQQFEYINNISVIFAKPEKQLSNLFSGYLCRMIAGKQPEYEDENDATPAGYLPFMTIHQSKGLEFPIVIVGSLYDYIRNPREKLVEKIRKTYDSSDRNNIEDEQFYNSYDFYRKYYTAFSRAKDLLVLSCQENTCPSKCFVNVYKNLPDYEAVDLSSIKAEPLKALEANHAFSFTSHINVYRNCPAQYKFHKFLELPRIKVQNTMFGTIVHATIEDIHRVAINGEYDKINDKNIQEWFNVNYSTLSQQEHTTLTDKQQASAVIQVKNYVGKYSNDWSMIKEAESEVSLARTYIDSRDEVKRNYILLGKVDLIRGYGDTLEIVDFKTEQKPDMSTNEGKEWVEHHFNQLQVYSSLITKKTGKTVSMAHLYYTCEPNEPQISFPIDSTNIDSTMDKIDQTVSDIMSEKFDCYSKDKQICYNCDMKDFCRKNFPSSKASTIKLK